MKRAAAERTSAGKKFIFRWIEMSEMKVFESSALRWILSEYCDESYWNFSHLIVKDDFQVALCDDGDGNKYFCGDGNFKILFFACFRINSHVFKKNSHMFAWW